MLWFLILITVFSFLLHFLFKRKIKKSFSEIIASLSLVIGVTALICFLLLTMVIGVVQFSYPKKTKNINNELYFIETQKGAVGAVFLWFDFYKVSSYWLDKKIGSVVFDGEHGDFSFYSDVNVRIVDESGGIWKKLIIESRNKIVLDTPINCKEKFDIRIKRIK